MIRNNDLPAFPLRKFGIRKSTLVISYAVLFAAGGVSVQAQEAASGDSPASLEEIVVTGTYIRGIEPSGSQIIGINAEDVAATGAVSSAELLGTLPQASNLFGQRTSITPGAGSQVQVVRPNLRNLPGGSLATGAATLVLVDGHRMPGVGVRQVATDPDMIPPGVIERVEIITDGGSSLYGADAIGGVINFITRRHFDGVKIDAGFSMADDYTSFDTNVTAGTSWSTGSAYISYSYADQDEILAKDRSWAKDIDWSTGRGFDTECAVPNVNVTESIFVGPPQFFQNVTTSYAAPDFTANTINHCDNSQQASLSPAMDRESWFTGLSQDLGESVELDVRAFFSERKSAASQGPQTATGRMESQNPYYIDVDGQGSPQSVEFSFEPYAGNRDETTSFEAWGITPELKVTFSNDWQLRTLLNYGRSESRFVTPQVNSSLLTRYGQGNDLTNAVNYYDLTATANPRLLDNLLNWALIGNAEDEIFNARAIVDGTVLDLPGGALSIAVGAEYYEEEFSRRDGAVEPALEGTIEEQSYKRDVSAIFGEVQIPLVGEGNRITGVESLTLSLSARHDDYSDFGSTTNPNVGITYAPVDWITFRGTWGESFNAPTPLDQLASELNTVDIFPSLVVPNPNDPPAPGTQTIAVQGAAPDLEPQTAETWSLGFDMEPPALSGFRASLNYYGIDFEGTLSKPPAFDPSDLYANYPDYFIMHPTSEEIAAAGQLASTNGGPEAVAPFLLPGAPDVYNIIFFLTDNLGNSRIEGLDFTLDQIFEMNFGTLNLGVSGNYRLESETQPAEGLPWLDELEFGEPEYYVKATVGATMGNFLARANWNYRDGYEVMQLSNRQQDSVDAFDTVDLFFRYTLNGSDWRRDLSLSLNVDNVFDQDPPEWRENGDGGYDNGFTLGRMFRLSISKRF